MGNRAAEDAPHQRVSVGGGADVAVHGRCRVEALNLAFRVHREYDGLAAALTGRGLGVH